MARKEVRMNFLSPKLKKVNFPELIFDAKNDADILSDNVLILQI